MDIIIRKLSPKLLNDYLYYFDNVAFTDHKEWSGCYCVEPHLCESVETELSEGTKSSCRDTAIKFINERKLQGYLAYFEDKVVGWCNTNDKLNYEKVKARKEFLTEDDSDKKIKSVMCFNISKNMRGKGIATKLLERICKDATSENYDIIEAYPYSGEPNEFYYFSGPPTIYKKQGFSIYKELENELIVRKYLK